MSWALGKAKAATALMPLLRLLHDYGNILDEESTWQALVALENYIVPDQWNANARNYCFGKILLQSCEAQSL